MSVNFTSGARLSPLSLPAHVAPLSLPAWASTPERRQELPVLTGSDVTLRDLRVSDASSLALLLTTDQVTRFISPPPTTVEGFERFITWANARCVAGEYMCFAVVPRGTDTAVGIIQFRQLGHDFSTAEWGFALGEQFWGTGLFMHAAELALEFAFECAGVRRLEARAAVLNERGNGVLRKLGARLEGVLAKSSLLHRRPIDQYLWVISRPDRPAIQHTSRWVH